MDLSRLSERLWAWLKRAFVRGGASASASVTHSNFEFEYGSNYAIMLTVLAICLVFSTVVPLIMPFGVVYFLVKAGVDEYLLTQVVSPHPLQTSQRAVVARFALDMVHVPVLLFLTAMLGFFTTSVCAGGLDAPSHAQSPLSPPPLPDSVSGDEDDTSCVLADTGDAGQLVMRGTPAQVASLTLCLVGATALALVNWREQYVGRFRLVRG